MWLLLLRHISINILDPVQRKSTMDCNHIVHLLGVLSGKFNSCVYFSFLNTHDRSDHNLCQTVLGIVWPKKKYKLFHYTFNQKILKRFCRSEIVWDTLSHRPLVCLYLFVSLYKGVSAISCLCIWQCLVYAKIVSQK